MSNHTYLLSCFSSEHYDESNIELSAERLTS